ncbi:MAG: hypothetical protein WBM14_07230 [Terracidiphilus sp.]
MKDVRPQRSASPGFQQNQNQRKREGLREKIVSMYIGFLQLEQTALLMGHFLPATYGACGKLAASFAGMKLIISVEK